MVLAGALTDWINPIEYTWQAPLLLGLFVVWLGVGSFLLRMQLKKLIPVKTPKFGRCMLIVFLFGFSAALIGGVFFSLVNNVLLPGNWIAAAIVGGGLAVPAALVTVYSMTNLPFGKAISAAILPVATELVVCGGLAAACAIPAHMDRAERTLVQNCIESRVSRLVVGIDSYRRDNDGRYPPNLKAIGEALVSKNKDQNAEDAARYIRCPARPQMEEGFFYHAPPAGIGNEKIERIILCDFASNHRGRGRNVIFLAYGQGPARIMQKWSEEADFQKKLADPENKDFAAALKAADK